MSNLIQAAELEARLGDPQLRIIDARFDLADSEAGQAAYRAGHIPGAIYLSLSRDRSGPAAAHGGRHPLPDPDRFASLLGSRGISDRNDVVVYDDTTGMYASRVWWMLRYMGHGSVKVLDGGMTAWLDAGLPLESAPAEWPPVEFRYSLQPEMVVDRQYLLDHLGDAGLQLLDARSPERFRGEQVLLDPLPGHIPGARNFHYADNLDGARLKDARELRERFADLAGAGEVVSYCGSGVSGTNNLLALEEAGLPGGRLYVGSWSDWSSHAAAPVATGPEAQQRGEGEG
jgi:thiosulfate/3-mercaptopyruvate sulfurtransferase